MLVSRKTLNIANINALITDGHCVTLMIRHAERPPLDPQDPTFGVELALTQQGVESSRRMGELLKSDTDLRFAASPMVRCRMTAVQIAQGMGDGSPLVHTEKMLGVDGFFYENSEEVHSAMQERGFMPFMMDYLRTGEAPYSRPLRAAAREMATWFKQQPPAALGIYVSHDIFVASLLSGLEVQIFTPDTWVSYLQGAALVREPGGQWSCQPFIPEVNVITGVTKHHYDS